MASLPLFEVDLCAAFCLKQIFHDYLNKEINTTHFYCESLKKHSHEFRVNLKNRPTHTVFLRVPGDPGAVDNQRSA